MANYDIFNGDADGICALIQLRLEEPRKAKLITGVKRDINLFEKIEARRGDHITALDISMRTNKDGLGKALEQGAHVFYVDHHNAGDIPKHENLFAVIDTRPNICTSLLVNKALNGAHKEWAIVGAFGDNLGGPARAVAKDLSLNKAQLSQLKSFGTLINYNAYGRSVSDLHFAPIDLYEQLYQFETPSACINSKPQIFDKLESGYADDLGRAQSVPLLSQGIYILSDAPWARRISGSFGNALASANMSQAHAVLTHNEDASYTVSVRAPKDNLRGADTLCMQFPTGGGRAGAAGINRLPKSDLDEFIDAFKIAF